MTKVEKNGGVGGAQNGGGHCLFARVDKIVKEQQGRRYYITLIRPPNHLNGITSAFLVGRIPTEIKLGDYIKVAHWQREGFAFRGIASFDEVRKGTGKAEPGPQVISKRTDTQPLLPIARIASAQFIGAVSPTSPNLKVDEVFFDKGIFVKQQPPKILKDGQLLIIPPKFLSQAKTEDYKHGETVAFLRLSSKMQGSGYALGCTRAICERMEKLLQMMREGRFFSAEAAEAKEVAEKEVSSPLFRKLDPARFLIKKIFPQEIITELEYELGVLFVQNRNETLSGKTYFRLALDRVDEKTGIIDTRDPGNMTALDLMETLVNLDFRALVIGSAPALKL